jgi:Fe-S-cluster containining protein
VSRRASPGRQAARPARTAAPLARPSLLRADRDVVLTIDAAVARAARLAGPNLACRPGCSECCIGPFPINRLDASRLRQGLLELRDRDPQRAAAIVERASLTVERFEKDFPGDRTTGRLSGEEADEDRFFEAHAAVPCPVLDPTTQTCDLYAHRPVSCRTYGPPVRFGGQDLPPCRLCFQGAPRETIEACRVEPDPAGLERAVLGRLERGGGDAGETVIAYAVIDER